MKYNLTNSLFTLLLTYRRTPLFVYILGDVVAYSDEIIPWFLAS